MRVKQAAILCASLALAAGARAAVTTYTSQSAFSAAIAGLAQVASEDFDGVAAQTQIPSSSGLGGFTFQYDLGGESLLVVDDFPTTSGANGLGVTGDLVFLASDAFTIQFPSATAIGLHVIGEDMLPGDVELRTAAGSVFTGVAENVLADGSEVYFLGLVESDPGLAFTSANVVSYAVEDVGDFVWSADDLLAAPEPGGAGWLAAGALLFKGLRRESRPRSARCASRPGR